MRAVASGVLWGALPARGAVALVALGRRSLAVGVRASVVGASLVVLRVMAGWPGLNGAP
jgi:hypothetical protein